MSDLQTRTEKAFSDRKPKWTGARGWYELENTTNGQAMQEIKSKLKSMGISDLRRGKFMGSGETVLIGKEPDGGSLFCTVRTKVRIGRPSSTVTIEVRAPKTEKSTRNLEKEIRGLSEVYGRKHWSLTESEEIDQIHGYHLKHDGIVSVSALGKEEKAPSPAKADKPAGSTPRMSQDPSGEKRLVKVSKDAMSIADFKAWLKKKGIAYSDCYTGGANHVAVVQERKESQQEAAPASGRAITEEVNAFLGRASWNLSEGDGYEIKVGQRGGKYSVKKFKNKSAAMKWIDKNGDDYDDIQMPDKHAEMGMDLSSDQHLESVRVDDAEYRFTHGRAPKGDGSWGFQIDSDPKNVFWFNGSYGDAKKAASKKAKFSVKVLT